MENEIAVTIRELQIRNYSLNTVRSYVNGLRKYFKFKKQSLRTLDIDNIKNFPLYCKIKSISSKIQNQYLNAIKFYYCNIAGVKEKLRSNYLKGVKAFQ